MGPASYSWATTVCTAIMAISSETDVISDIESLLDEPFHVRRPEAFVGIDNNSLFRGEKNDTTSWEPIVLMRLE